MALEKLEKEIEELKMLFKLDLENRLRKDIEENKEFNNCVADLAMVCRRVFAAGVFYYGVKWSWQCARKVAGLGS